MNLSYLSRGACLVIATFFLVHLVTTLLIELWTTAALRTARRLTPTAAARFLLTLRLLPTALAAFVALGLAAPSYFWFEPEGIDEQVGVACLFFVTLGLVICGGSALRAIAATVQSLRLAGHCRLLGRELGIASGGTPVIVMASSAPFLALAGLVRPRIVTSEDIMNTLSEEELSVVLSHEHAHRTSRDNLKRLCIFLAPRVVPFVSGGARLEREWSRYAEYAADAQAVAGDARRSMALASALVRVARLGTIAPVSPLAISFLADINDLSTRVDRLLTEPTPIKSTRGMSLRSVGPVLILAGWVAALLFHSSTFQFVQSVLERLIR